MPSVLLVPHARSLPVKAVSSVLADARVGVVDVSGEVDLASVGVLRQAISDHLAAGLTMLLLDLSEVTFIDSTGLGVLVGAGKRATGAGGSVRLVVDDPRILRLLTLTGLTVALSVHPSRASALSGWVSVTA